MFIIINIIIFIIIIMIINIVTIIMIIIIVVIISIIIVIIRIFFVFFPVREPNLGLGHLKLIVLWLITVYYGKKHSLGCIF